MPEWLPRLAPALAEHLGRFTPIRPIDMRGPEIVYLARDPDRKRQVAIKLLREDAPGNADVRTQYRQSLIRSGMTLSKLQHPNIVALHELGTPADGVYLVMEYLDGGSLEQMFSAFGSLSPADLAPVAAGIAAGLDYVHGIGIVHCDVRPGKILLDGAGGCRLSGFSLARSPDATSAGTATSLPRSLVFTAPELLKGTVVPASDQFSLAAVMYRGLTGCRPFRALEIVALIGQILRDTPEPASALREGLPKAVDEVLRRAMSVNPGDRFQNCTEFAEAFAEALTGGRRIWKSMKNGLNARRWLSSIR